jgi:hypothetical protein
MISILGVALFSSMGWPWGVPLAIGLSLVVPLPSLSMSARSRAKARARKHRPCYVYVIGPANPDKSDKIAFKVGISVNPERRLKSIQTGCHFEVAILTSAWFRGTKQAREFEVQVHSCLKTLNTHGEWFSLSSRDLRRLCMAVRLKKIGPIKKLGS